MAQSSAPPNKKARPAATSAEPFVPETKSLPTLREAARTCQGCDLYLAATQTVFGEGPRSARVVFVGEQPGDAEDLQGRPFVGPAGRVFDAALKEAGLSRKAVYVTNAVKHFSFEQRGKARLHKRPRPGQVRACLPWLRAELGAVRPRVLVLLGATAGQALFGPSFRVSTARGKRLPSDLAGVVISTIHPSAVLRTSDSDSRAKAFAQLVDDLRAVQRELEAEE